MFGDLARNLVQLGLQDRLVPLLLKVEKDSKEQLVVAEKEFNGKVRRSKIMG